MAREDDKKDKDAHSSSNVQSTRSDSGGIKDAAATASRGNTTAAPSVAPTTRAGNDTRDTSSTASMVSGSSDTGTPSRGNASGGIGSAVMEALGGNTGRGNTQSPTFDAVDPHPNSGGWDNFTDFTSTLSPAAARPSSGYDVPGEPTSLADYLQGVRNGSLGSPRSAAYGTSGDTSPQPSLLDQIGGAVHDFAQGPYQRRVDANGGVAPFDGPIDMQGIYDALQAPNDRRRLGIGTSATGGALESPETIARPTVRIRVNGGNTSPSWQEMRARLLAADRLPSDPNNPNAVAPAYTGDTAIARDRYADGSYSAPLEAIQSATGVDVPLPRRDPRGYADLFDTNGQVTSPNGAIVRAGGPADAVVPEKPAAPSTWDKVVDGAGQLLSHTALGGIVSSLFPDAWNGMGDKFKGLDDGGLGHMGSFGGTSPVDIQNDINRTVMGDPKSGRTQLEGFIDLNHNGVDDRLEGYTGTDTQPVTPATPPGTSPTGAPSTSNIYDHAGDVVFPTMPPYQPGKDNEWLYFRKKMAAGGIVGYADGGPMAGNTPDPKFALIADTEDVIDHVLKSGKPTAEDNAMLAKFVQQFGPDALQKLAANVKGGMKIRSNQSRLVQGPGGPTDDAVPAQTDSGEQVRLSNGEFIMPVAAVAGMGDGDHKLGAERLQQLSERLAAARG